MADFRSLGNKFDHQSGEYLDVDGARIYYEVAGKTNGPALLLLHGGFGNMEDFNGVLAGVASKYKIIGIDSRGQGKSTLGSRLLTYEQMQKDVEAVLKQLNIRTVTIVGFSDGGIVAYRLASSSTVNVKRLVAIGTRWHVKNTEPTREMFLAISGESWRAKFPFMYDVYQRLNPDPDFDELAKALVRMWLDPLPSGHPNEAVENIQCPVLIIRGEEDPLVSREAVVELSKLLKKATLFNIPSAGHVAFMDQKKIFMDALNKFLK